MTWERYVTKMEEEGCMYAAFFDHDGNKWSESKNPCFHITPEQIQHLVKGIRPPKTVDLSTQGPKLGDRKFLVVAVTDTVAVLKEIRSDEGNCKIMACIGVFGKGVCVGAAAAGEREKCSRISVEKYTDYLKSQSY